MSVPRRPTSAASIRLSIVVPTHNTRELTLRCLDALNPIPPTWEVIVVDDASTDGTSDAVASRRPELTLLTGERRAGFSGAANRGLAAASGELLLLLNSDTEVATGSLAALERAFDHEPRLGVGGAELRFPDGSPQWSAGRRPSALWLFAQASGLPALVGRLPGYRRVRPPGRGAGAKTDWVSGAAMAMRREVWQATGPLDEGYRFYCQDVDLCLAAGELGWRVAVIPGFVVIHHHGATISSAGGTAARYHPELMWTDLVRFAGKRGGRRGARRAAAVLRAGARLRLMGRAVAAPFVRGEDRTRWRLDSEAFAAGLRALADSRLKIED